MLAVIHLEGWGALTHYLQWYIDVESDCEGDSAGVGDGELEPEEEKEEQTRAVLTTGSFPACVHSPSCLYLPRNDDSSSWKSLFFYRCAEEEEKEEQTRAVLTTGSFSAYVHSPSCLRLPRNDDSSSWKSLFFYRCTDVILFAPLRSQGVDARSDYIRRNKGAAVPPPCSPKSIHVLASLVRKSPIKCLIRATDTVNQARAEDPSRPRTRRYQE